MCARRQVVGGAKAPQDRRDLVQHLKMGLRVLGRRTRHRHRHGRALLEQQLRGLNDRLGTEPPPHRRLEQDVGQGDNRHPLVMGHVGLDDFAGRRRREAATVV